MQAIAHAKAKEVLRLPQYFQIHSNLALASMKLKHDVEFKNLHPGHLVCPRMEFKPLSWRHVFDLEQIFSSTEKLQGKDSFV